jgi:hypothetical protein
VRLGEDQDATFEHHPSVPAVWIRKGQAAFDLPYFDPTGYTDEMLVKKLKTYGTFS